MGTDNFATDPKSDSVVHAVLWKKDGSRCASFIIRKAVLKSERNFLYFFVYDEKGEHVSGAGDVLFDYDSAVEVATKSVRRFLLKNKDWVLDTENIKSPKRKRPKNGVWDMRTLVTIGSVPVEDLVKTINHYRTHRLPMHFDTLERLIKHANMGRHDHHRGISDAILDYARQEESLVHRNQYLRMVTRL